MSGTRHSAVDSPFELVVVVGSLGALGAFKTMLDCLSASFAAAVVFDLHRAEGNRFAERLLTVALSCRQQARPLLAFLVGAGEAASRGSVPPSLLAAPQGC